FTNLRYHHLSLHDALPISTNFSFKDNEIQIPNYKYFKQFVEELHKNILHHDYVSWDIAVGHDGQPVFIEPNFRGTTWRYQLASQDRKSTRLNSSHVSISYD